MEKGTVGLDESGRMARTLLSGELLGKAAFGEMGTDGAWTYYYSRKTMEATVAKYSGFSISPDIPSSFFKTI